MKKLVEISRLLSFVILTASAVIFLGCEQDDADLPQVTAGFTYTLNEDTGAVSFINTSENATKYVWDFGDGRTTTEINPIRAFASGSHTVTLTASNIAGASDVFEDVIIIDIPLPLNLPITFDDPNVNYEAVTFGGTSFSVVENPGVSGSNDVVSQVGEITNAGAEFEGISFDVGMPIDLTSEKTISMNFWSETAIPVLLKLEDGTGADIEVSTTHSGSGWEILEFEFSSSNSYSRLTIFADGPGTTAGTFYIDDIEQTVTSAQCTPETEQDLTAEGFNMTFLNDPAEMIQSFDAQYSYVANPDFQNEVNASCFVGKIERNGGALFANNQIVFDNPLDFSDSQGLKLKVYSSAVTYDVLVKLENSADANINTELSRTTTVGANEWEELTFPFAASESGKYDKIVLFFELNTNTTETYYIDDFALYGEGNSGNGGGGEEFDSGLLVNGDFEDGAAPWTIGVGNDPVPIVTEGGNTYYSVNVTAAGNPFDVNMSQKLEITQGATYILTFDAWSDRERSIIAGIGLSDGDFSNTTEQVSINTERQTYTLSLTAAEFGAANARVLFDSGAEVGLVNIDNVSLKLDADAGGGEFDSGLLVNGDFEAGAAPWTIGVGTDPAPIATEGDNTYYSVDVTAAGNPYDVNLSQKLEITQGSTYTLTFDAWSDRERSIIAGIGLSDGDFSSTVEEVTIDTQRKTYTLTLTAVNFGANNARVLFDSGAQVGLVNIDNVSLTLNDGGGGSGGDGNFLTNGDFETGDETGWLFFDTETTNGGTAGISNAENNTAGGTYSARVQSGTQNNPGIKQERFGVGTIQPNQQLTVQFDSKIESLADGAVVNVLAFSESATEGKAAVLHNLGTINPTAGVWNTNTYNFTTAGDVTGGVSILFEVVCGGADTCEGIVYFDNVSVEVTN
ncbi:carbohydrate binding domain-containing protein [Salinimicrobium soli]|uniref:carbohydrate binding domain-containing protein n=1 Tax=Salinimicrobium soli TaxID=1254399 RepID=UPI003AAD14C4